MSNNSIITVMVAMIVGPFALLSYNDAVSIKQHLHEQSQHIEKLNTEYVKIDQELGKTQEIKEQNQAEVQKLEQAASETLNERQRLEAELGAN